MRVGSSTIYDSYIKNQERQMRDIVTTTEQVSSGVKIKYGYESPSIYADTLRLDSEEASMAQIKDTANKAKTYSDNTDVAIQQLKDDLEATKVKLIQAANGTHSTTSLNAIADDLEALKTNMLDVANTSINGTYLFAGTDVDRKPFDDRGNYYGNAEDLKANLGDGLEVTYNIDGQSLFFGTDIDYSKRITTNVQKVNMVEANHKVLDPLNPEGVDTEVFITESNSIKELVGQPDDTKSSYFYLRGRAPDGESFKAKMEFSNDGQVSDLLDQIGRAFGNTELASVVSVQLSEYGQIEVTDIQSGLIMSDFHLVATDQNVDDLDQLATIQDAHIFDFNKSGFAYTRTNSEVVSSQDFYDPRKFTVNGIIRDVADESYAVKDDLLRDVLGEDAKEIVINVNGNDYTHTVSAFSSVEDFLKNLETDLETETGHDFDVSIQYGQIAVLDNTASAPNQDTNIPTTLDRFSIKVNDGSGVGVKAFADKDGLSYDKARFEKEGAIISANVSQVVRETNAYATEGTSLNQVSGSLSLDEKVYQMDLVDVNGIAKTVEIKLRDIPDANGQLSTFRVVSPTVSDEYEIFDEYGNSTAGRDYTDYRDVAQGTELVKHKETINGVTYGQVFNIMEMVLSDNLPTSTSYEDYQTAITKSQNVVDASFDDKGRMQIKDLSNSATKMQMSFFDQDTNRFDDYAVTTDKTWRQTFTGVKGEPGWEIQETDPSLTLDKVFGFDFDTLNLDGTDFNGNPATVSINPTDTLQDLMDQMDITFGDGTVTSTVKVFIDGDQLRIRDNSTNNPSLVSVKMSFNNAKVDMHVNESPPITAMANNAITIDEANLDLFDQMDTAIEAVRTGTYRADADGAAARNMGIQNTIAMVDHMLDHVIRTQTENGSNSEALQGSLDRSEIMLLNVKTLKSSVIDTDIGEATLRLNKATLSYQALLSTIGKIQQLSLVNYI